MSADHLTRRAALIGAAAFLAPLTPKILLAAPNPSPSKTSLIKLDGNENPYGPSPAARQVARGAGWIFSSWCCSAAAVSCH